MAAFNWEDFLSGAGGLLGLLGGSAALMGAYDRLGGIGEAAQQGAMQIAQQGIDQSRFQPFTVTSTMGGTYGYDPETGTVSMGLSPDELAMQNSLFGQSRTFFDLAATDTAQRETDIYNRIRAAQMPQEAIERQNLEERLAAQGRLGVRTAQFGGTPEQLAQAKAQAEAQNTAMLGAMQQAQAEQAQQAALGQQYMAGSYMPQSQLLNVQQSSQLFPQLQQRGQLYGAGLFGEASMGGLEALLGAGLGQANLMGQLGTGLLSGLATPTDNYGGLGEVLSGGKDIYEMLFGPGGLFG